MSIYLKSTLAAFIYFVSIASFANTIAIDQGYVREVIPGNNITSAYMMIENLSDKPVSLVGATSDVSPRVEIHAHSMEAGMMKMRQLASLSIKPKQQLILQPMGFHLMMFELSRSIKSGETVNMTLSFSNGDQVDVTLPVHSIKQKKQHHHH